MRRLSAGDVVLRWSVQPARTTKQKRIIITADGQEINKRN